MPYVEVFVETDEVISSVSDKELIQELASRKLANILPTHEVADSLLRASDELRRIHRYDLSARLDDIRTQSLAA